MKRRRPIVLLATVTSSCATIAETDVIDERAWLQSAEPMPAPPKAVNPAAAAGWMVLAVVIAVFIYEMWALWKGRDTISRMIQRVAKNRNWFKWLGSIGMAILTFHIIWGFPGGKKEAARDDA